MKGGEALQTISGDQYYRGAGGALQTISVNPTHNAASIETGNALNKHQNPYIHRKNKPSAAAKAEPGAEYQTLSGRNPELGGTEEDPSSRLGMVRLSGEDSRVVDEGGNGKRTQTSFNSRVDQKSALSSNLLFKPKPVASVK